MLGERKDQTFQYVGFLISMNLCLVFMHVGISIFKGKITLQD